MGADAEKVRVEAELRGLSGNVSDIASRLCEIRDTLRANTAPLMDQPVCGTNAPGDNFKKDWKPQDDAIHEVFTSYVKNLEGIADGTDKSVKLLDHIEVDNTKQFTVPTGSVIGGVRGGGKA